jgi:hypothetical protein
MRQVVVNDPIADVDDGHGPLVANVIVRSTV